MPRVSCWYKQLTLWLNRQLSQHLEVSQYESSKKLIFRVTQWLVYHYPSNTWLIDISRKKGVLTLVDRSGWIKQKTRWINLALLFLLSCRYPSTRDYVSYLRSTAPDDRIMGAMVWLLDLCSGKAIESWLLGKTGGRGCGGSQVGKWKAGRRSSTCERVRCRTAGK